MEKSAYTPDPSPLLKNGMKLSHYQQNFTKKYFNIFKVWYVKQLHMRCKVTVRLLSIYWPRVTKE